MAAIPPTNDHDIIVGGEGSLLSFSGGIFIAQRQITHDFTTNPSATLYQIDCTPSSNPAQPVHSGISLSQLTLTCRTPTGHLTITDKGWWSTWEPAITHPAPIVGNNNLGWDVPKQLGLEEAARLVLAEEGAEGGFFKATLTFPQHPSPRPVQPYYVFAMALGGQSWWVGLEDRKVYKPASE